MVERNIGKRWEDGLHHHPKSVELFRALEKIDIKYGEDSFGWTSGGDEGKDETLMYELDIYFECQDAGEEI